jgi:hypothetical protein
VSPPASPVRLRDETIILEKEKAMKYAMLICPKPGSEEALEEDERNSVSAEYLALRDDLRCVGGAHLQPGEMATTVRAGGGETLGRAFAAVRITFFRRMLTKG